MKNVRFPQKLVGKNVRIWTNLTLFIGSKEGQKIAPTEAGAIVTTVSHTFCSRAIQLAGK